MLPVEEFLPDSFPSHNTTFNESVLNLLQSLASSLNLSIRKNDDENKITGLCNRFTRFIGDHERYI